jgi:hypothetical protein
MTRYKNIALLFCLCLFSIICIASVPESMTLGGIVYIKADENIMGNHKSSEYIPTGQTMSNWTSMVAIHYFMFEKDPIQFAQHKFGDDAKIENIDGDKNNILQFFNTMNPVGGVGDPIILQQNVWRYQQLNFDKGIIAIEYATRKTIPNQTAPQGMAQVSQQLQDEIKALPIDQYSF